MSIDKDHPEQIYRKVIPEAFLTTYDQAARIDLYVQGYTSPGSPWAADLRLGFEYHEDHRVGAVNLGSPTTPFLSMRGSSGISTENPYHFKWGPERGCHDVFPNTQLQVLRLYNIDTSYTEETEVRAVVDWSQALTVETGNIGLFDMYLTLAEGTGYYIWRVRPIGSMADGGIANDTNWGLWSTAPADGAILDFTNPLSLPDYAICYQQFDDDLIWAYSRNFTEGTTSSGTKIAEGMAYATPSMIPRQSQARVMSDQGVIAAESVADNTGSGSLQTLPVPIDGDALYYREEVIMDGSDPYTAANYDDDLTFDDPDPADGGEVDVFYSSTNTDESIPDASGYPFSRVLHGTDGTSRPREASGPGWAHRLGGNAGGKDRTVKMYYSGVSDWELIRVFGSEAPKDTTVTKVLMLDPNKVTSVAYYAGGALIATAYDTRQGDTLLAGLDEDSITTELVLDTLKGDRQRGTHGFSSQKRLAFTDTTELRLYYRIATDTVHYDGCSSGCMTCDYKVSLFVHDLNDPENTIEYPIFLGGEDCSGAPPSYDTGMILTLPPGEYQIERRVQTHNIDPTSISGSDPAGKTFADNFRQRLAGEFEAEIRSSSEIIAVQGFLDSNDFEGLYDYLEINPEVPEYALIETPCCTLNIPIIDPDCGGNPCKDGTPDFEGYMISKWGSVFAPGGDTNNLNNYFQHDGADRYPSTMLFPDGKGAFNALIGHMLSDTTAGYSCKDLWMCWTSLMSTLDVASFIDGDPDERRPDFDLLDQFLKCAGTRYINVSTSAYGSTGYLEKAYKYFNYTIGANHLCDSVLGYNAGWLNNADSSSRWRELEGCVVAGNRSASEIEDELMLPCVTASSSPVDRDSCLMQMKRRTESECRSRCSERRSEFESAVRSQYGWGVSMDTVVCLAEAMIAECESQCSLTVHYHDDNPTEHIDSIGTYEEFAQMQKIYGWRAFVDTSSVCADSTASYPGTEVDIRPIVLDRLNGLLRAKTMHEVGPEGAEWNIRAELRKILPPALANSIITDSVVWVRYRDESAHFVYEDSCELWYRGDTIVCGTPESPHALVDALNAYVNEFWAYGIDAGDDQATTECVTADGTVIGRRYEYSLFEEEYEDRMEWYDSSRFTCVNGYARPKVLSDFITTSAPDESDLIDTAFTAYRKSTSHKFVMPFVNLKGCNDSLLITIAPEVGGGHEFCDTADKFGWYRYALMGSVQCGTELYYHVVDARVEGVFPLYDSLLLWIKSPFTERIGRFGQDAQGYLVFYPYRRETGYYDTATAERIFGIRFFSAISQKVSDDACGTIGCPAACFGWRLDTIARMIPDSVFNTTCEERAASKIRAAIDEGIARCVGYQLRGLDDLYRNKCGSADSLDDELIIKYPLHLYHFTLYYYDRAGRLVKTVPPKFIDDNATTRSTRPSHGQVTKIWYNSFGLPVTSYTPDGLTIQYFYDRLGRLRFSQNAQQENDGEYSYIKYDDLGRALKSAKAPSRPAATPMPPTSRITPSRSPAHNEPIPSTPSRRASSIRMDRSSRTFATRSATPTPMPAPARTTATICTATSSGWHRNSPASRASTTSSTTTISSAATSTSCTTMRDAPISSIIATPMMPIVD